MSTSKLIAFYLPQYHPVAENNKWWGAGFTEWTNVSRARPRFFGHRQPHIPADLGFYDLRLRETKLAQIELAKKYGINGFCYYHYWFNGNILLGGPLKSVVEDDSLDFPFCVCWANENWTRAWDGLDKQVLIEQIYSIQDNREHINYLLPIFRDQRYIKIGGCPLLLIYRLNNIPNCKQALDGWRSAAKQFGFPDLYICVAKTGFDKEDDAAILNYGVDAIVDFQPNSNDFPKPRDIVGKLQGLAKKLLPNAIYQGIKIRASSNKIISYEQLFKKLSSRAWPSSYRKFPCVFPSWDNSSRRKSATIIQNDNVENYGAWLKSAIEAVEPYPVQERLVFINAWNEWAEGCHLEPDLEMGHSYLEETQVQVRNAGHL
jgi:lipopolysaccharide biosynthesis protein